MKNNNPEKNVPKAAHAVPTKPNVCGMDTADSAGKGKAGANAIKSCEEKIDSAVEALKTPGAESA
ncbi:MAG: hypothetical protein HXX11_11540 [Desulfuromonadales bacterium]|nr:hypothetical protein [Desulfuromonadales bacterium]